MRKHAAAGDAVALDRRDGPGILALATRTWAECLKTGEANGWRNSQASVLAPTGCLTADTLVTTDRGLTRLSQLGDRLRRPLAGPGRRRVHRRGPRAATRFFVNGEEPTRRIVTQGGYRIQGTLAHRVKVVDPETGAWVWKRLAEVVAGDVVPCSSAPWSASLAGCPCPCSTRPTTRATGTCSSRSS